MFSCFFKKRRLINRLWKLRRAYVGIDENRFLRGAGDKNSKFYREFVDFKRWFFKILTTLTLSQLEIFLQQIVDEGCRIGECIFVDLRKIFSFSSSTEKKLSIDDEYFELTKFILKTFCQPDLTSSSSISPLPWCNNQTSGDEENMVCVNPYHFGVLHAVDTARKDATLPRFNKSCTGATQYESSTSSSGCCEASCFSNTISGNCDPPPSCFHHMTDGNISVRRYSPYQGRNGLTTQRGKRIWCHMAYWEHDVRVGNLLPVDEPLAFCYFTLPFSSSTSNCCLLNLQNTTRVDRPEVVLRTRQKIGRGFVLYTTTRRKLENNNNNKNNTTNSANEEGDVLLHNRGPSMLFVRSNYLHKNAAVRLLPGYTLLVHRFGRYDEDVDDDFKPTHNVDDDGPLNPPSVLISFCKGWGTNYSRTVITCCPCWVQVIFDER